MAAKTVHMVSQYYLTVCGKDSKNWKDRADRVRTYVRDVTCPHCLALMADNCIRRLDVLKGSTRTIHQLREDLKEVIEGPVIVRD